MRTVPLLLTAVLAGSGCPANVIQGAIGGESVDVVESVVFELRGIDQGTSLPFHDLTVWMMPISDSCARYGQLVSDLAGVRQQLEDGQDPNEHCADWAAVWADFIDNEPFWINRLALQARPRADDVTPATTYPYVARGGEQAPDGPWFNASLARHGAPDLERCAEVFAGTDWFPTVSEVTGGEVTVTRYTEDVSLKGTMLLEIEGEEPLTGGFDAQFCPASVDWPLELSFSL